MSCTWCSMNIRGGVHQLPPPRIWIPNELPPLKPVAVEAPGDDSSLSSSAGAGDSTWASAWARMATTYSYVEIPCKRLGIFMRSWFWHHERTAMYNDDKFLKKVQKALASTFLISIRWKKKSSPRGTEARKATNVHTNCKNNRTLCKEHPLLHYVSDISRLSA